MESAWTRKAFHCCRSLNVKLCFVFLFFVCFFLVRGQIIVCAPLFAYDNLDYKCAYSVNKLVSKTETSVLAELITATGLALSS